jgi:N-acyl homoserine lactone hydrolase
VRSYAHLHVRSYADNTAVFFSELDEPRTEGQRLVRALDPELVWLSHEHEPWRPQGGRQV